VKAEALTVIRGTTAARYDRALLKAKDGRLPASYPRPQPTGAWPPENVALLERYRDWLVQGGMSAMTINALYVPTAGHVLGLQLKPHPELNLDTDLQCALDYAHAKRLSKYWLKNTRIAIAKFKQFLHHERGQTPAILPPKGKARYCDGLPAWLVEALERYCHLRQAHWRPARSNYQALAFWQSHTQVWRFMVERQPLPDLLALRRQHLLDFVDDRLARGQAASTINNNLRCFHAFLLYLQDQEYPVPQALLREPPSLKEPERLPRFLTDEQVRKVRDAVEARVTEAKFFAARRDALLARAAFYLLWHCGLRLGEVEDLVRDDLDVRGKKLTIRRGKGQKDRVVFLTETTLRALEAYLAVRGDGTSNHVFLYRHHPVNKDLIYCRIRAAGERVGVKVSPHQLRHTCATQLLNAGCRITSIQKLLGHRKLNSTLIYARVHDQTVSDDYYAAMTRIETSLNLSVEADAGEPPSNAKHAHVLELVNRLAAPQLGLETRLDLVAQLRQMLNGKTPEPVGAQLC
jgi:integrase